MEQVIIVFADSQPQVEENEEFLELIQACEMEVAEIFTQLLKSITLRTYIGKGKCEEIQAYVENHKVERIVFNQDLSPLQIRNLEAIVAIPVMDRTELILEIFKKRAVSAVARLQVESAHSKKLLPRLVGANMQLGRQSGSGKNKGTGEKQLEIDRRRIKARIAEIARELKEVEAERSTQRRARKKSALPLVSLVGYTNAGKSTIMNRLLTYSEHQEEKMVLEKDMLFATLDTSIRKIELPKGASFLLSDTVGFVSNLPHSLIQAFHSTLEEVKHADLLLHVVDASSKEHEKQIRVTMETLKEIEASDIPMITIYNKCDQTSYTYPKVLEHELYISTREDESIQALLNVIHEHLHDDEITCTMCLPYAKASIYSHLMENAHVMERKDEEDGIHLQVRVSSQLYETYKSYVIKR